MGKDNFTKIPNGINGIEDRMAVVWNSGVNTGVLTPSDFVRVTSTNTAKIFNLYPRKGVIKEGSDADVLVWDPSASKVISAATHHHGGDFNIFEGIKVNGLTETTIAGGRVVFENNEVKSTPGSGKFMARENYGFVYERIPAMDRMRDEYEKPIDRSNP
jgi:dihydropyrimidinase